MRYKDSFLLPLILILLCLSACASAQQWSGILAPTRAINWSNAGVPGGIPSRTSICSTLSAGASVSQINSAISACPSGQVVYLNAGTYSGLSGIIQMKSGVTLRGAGPDQTFLVWSAPGSCGFSALICIWNGDGNWQGGPDNSAKWTAGYAQGTTSITLSSVTNLKVGQLLVLDQANPSADTGNIWACMNNPNGSSTYNVSPYCTQNPDTSSSVSRPDHSQQQQVVVASCGTSTSGAACTSTNVTITPGLYAPNWNSGQSPGAWWETTMPITGAGVENLNINGASASGSGSTGVMILEGYGNWVKNVAIINLGSGSAAPLSSHVFLANSSHNTVRDSYMYGSVAAAEGYGIDSGYSSSDNLFENNISQHVAGGICISEGATGDVCSYNYSIDDFFGSNWQIPSQQAHASGDNYILYEGNEGIGQGADNINGNHFMITTFRNYLTGHDTAAESPAGPRTSATYAYFPYAYSRYFNLIGSVLGTQSYHTIYQSAAASTTDCGSSSNASKSVFVLGYSDQNGINYSPSCFGSSFTIPNDLKVASTLMRWGNYAACTGDSNCNAVRWVSSEVPSSDPYYPNPVPSTETLPASFYLSAQPSWWGSMPWPAVGPDVTGGNVANVGGHAYLNPAANCYLNVLGGATDGTSGVLGFNASNCYPTGGGGNAPPAPPTNLQATVD